MNLIKTLIVAAIIAMCACACTTEQCRRMQTASDAAQVTYASVDEVVSADFGGEALNRARKFAWMTLGIIDDMVDAICEESEEYDDADR